MNFSPEDPKNKIKDPEAQFDKRRKVEVLGGTIEVADISPENPKTETPVIFAPGWGETPEVLKDALMEMSRHNRRVISFSHARGSADAPSLKSYPGVEMQKALALLELLKEGNFEKVDVVAHSEGAINTVIAASMMPERFRNIVFIAPGGMMGKDKFPRLAGGFAKYLIQSALRARNEPGGMKNIFRSGIGAGKYISANPLKALKEVVAISESEIHEMLRELHREGIGISIIHGVDDPIFPMEKIQEIAKSDQIDGFYSVKGSHNDMYLRADQYMELADEALTALERKKS